MHTQTVLDIIKMIDNQMQSNIAHPDEQFYSNTYSYRIGNLDALRELKDHLQSYIEAQVSYAENKTGE
jgi:hypothetical protein